MLSALFAVNDVIQPRSIERIWKLSGKDIHAEPEEEHSPAEESPVWKLLERFRRASPNDLPGLDKDTQAAIARVMRDWRLRSLRGFIAMERGDLKTAGRPLARGGGSVQFRPASGMAYVPSGPPARGAGALQ